MTELAYARALHHFVPTAPIQAVLVPQHYAEITCSGIHSTDDASNPLEHHLWRIMSLYLEDVAHASSKAAQASAATLTRRIRQDSTTWAIPHRVLLRQLATTHSTIRRALLILAWLEETAYRHASRVNYHLRGWAHSMETSKSRGHNAPCVTDGIDILSKTDRKASDLTALDPRDVEQEEALMETMVRSLRQGDLHAAMRVAFLRGFPWRAALLQHTCPTSASWDTELDWMNIDSGDENVSNAPKNTGSAYPASFGEFATKFVADGLVPFSDQHSAAMGEDCLSECIDPGSDRNRIAVIANIYWCTQATVRARADEGADHACVWKRHEMLENALHGLLTGDVGLVLPVMTSWRDRLWATLRCHVISILSRYVIELSGVQHSEGIATHGGSPAMAQYIQFLIQQYGTSHDWIHRAEELIGQAALECLPSTSTDDFRVHTGTVLHATDHVLSYVVMALLTSSPSLMTMALETVAAHVTHDHPTFAVHFFDLIIRSWEAGLLLKDVRTPVRSLHAEVEWSPHDPALIQCFVIVLQHYWNRTIQEARVTTKKSDQYALLCAPVFVICMIQDEDVTLDTLATYCCEMHRCARTFLDPRDMEFVQDEFFSHLCQLMAIRRAGCDPSAVVTELRERIAFTSHGAADSPTSTREEVDHSSALPLQSVSSSVDAHGKPKGAIEIVMWLTSAVTREQSPRVLALTLNELHRVALLCPTLEGKHPEGTLNICERIVATVDRKVLPLLDSHLLTIPKPGPNQDQEIHNSHRKLRAEYMFWREFVHCKAEILHIYSSYHAKAPGGATVSDPSNTMATHRSSWSKVSGLTESTETILGAINEAISKLRHLTESASEWISLVQDCRAEAIRPVCSLKPLPLHFSPSFGSEGGVTSRSTFQQVFVQMGQLFAGAIRVGFEHVAELHQATALLAHYMNWAVTIEGSGLDAVLEPSFLGTIVDTAKELTMNTLYLQHVLRSKNGNSAGHNSI